MSGYVALSLTHFFSNFDSDETLVVSPPNQFRGLTGVENLLLVAAMDIFESSNNNAPFEFLQYIQMFVEERYLERLDSKMLAEGSTTLEVIKKLQAAGCWVFGLTSRYFNTVARTDDMLCRLGIDFSTSTPLPADLSLQDPGSQAVYCRGIIYTNAVDKGVVLNRFLENVLFRHVLDDEEKKKRAAAESQKSSMNDLKQRVGFTEGEGEFFSPDAASTNKLRVPSSIVFVDDRLTNVESVLNGVPLAENLGIPLHGYLYLAPSLQREFDRDDKSFPLSYCMEAHNSIDVMTEQLLFIRNQLTDASTIGCVDKLMIRVRELASPLQNASPAFSDDIST